MCFGTHDFLEVDDEFRLLIPKRTKHEDEQLEANILADGEIREPVVAWGTIVVDGMGRLKVARKHNLPFKLKHINFPDNNACKAWMLRNQLGRRNLTDTQISVMRGELYNLTKEGHGDEKRAKSSGNSPSGQNGREDLRDKTAKEIAAQHGTGARTIRRDGKLAEAVEKLTPEVATAVVNHEVRASRKAVEDLAAKPPAEQKKIVAKVQSGAAKTVQEAMKPKAGKPTTWHGDKTVESHYGKLVRSLDEKANAQGKGKHHKACLASLAEFLTHWNEWKAATA